MAYGKTKMTNGQMRKKKVASAKKKTFKPCASCPSKAACRKAGKCKKRGK
jgi:hypothetical protein